MKKITILLFVCYFAYGTIAFTQIPQDGLQIYHSFNDCEHIDTSWILSADIGKLGITKAGRLKCETRFCPVGGTGALRFDGFDDQLIFINALADIFGTADFSMSFYFRSDEGQAVQNIFSKRESCVDGNGFAIVYYPEEQKLRVLVGENEDRQLNLEATISTAICYTHVVVTREGANARLYLDGQLVDSDTADSPLDISNSIGLVAGSALCENRLSGSLDELFFYEKALSAEEITQLFGARLILNQDTLISQGDNLLLEVEPECSSGVFTWTPATGLTNANEAEPVLSASTTATYQLTLLEGLCIVGDTFRVNVIPIDPLFQLRPTLVEHTLYLNFIENYSRGSIIEVFNVLGALQYQVKLVAGTTHWEIPVEFFAPGSYFVRMTVREQSFTRPFVKK